MDPLFSEFSYGYTVTEELATGVLGFQKVRPLFPTQYQEAQPGGGYDVNLPYSGAPMYLQFKRADGMIRTKVLNEIGSSFINDGVVWISNILQNNPQYTSTELETNTVYYIENITRRFILINRQRIKATLSLKSQVIVILDFLLEKGSTTGFLLRDDIL